MKCSIYLNTHAFVMNFWLQKVPYLELVLNDKVSFRMTQFHYSYSVPSKYQFRLAFIYWIASKSHYDKTLKNLDSYFDASAIFEEKT